ncbi:MAG: DUF2852 domain-containing protein [Alphaproteobacteria bacterium]|nr:DUF2852 domain-containing protein [Alphaproteobacteria bacterium]
MSVAAAANDLPKPAWIVLMILGFIAFWPIGLAILFYLLWSGKMRCWKDGNLKEWTHKRTRFSSTGNSAFDEYREETLKRLEEEQREFTMFVKRLRDAKDQREFDQFMAERNGHSPA